MTRSAWADARIWAVSASACVAISCSAGSTDPAAVELTQEQTAAKFLSDRDFRRAALVESVVNPLNGYSARRLEHYATADDGQLSGWDALPEWNPPVREARADGVVEPSALVWNGETPATLDAWLDLGRTAFERWPTQIDDALAAALEPPAREQFGFWVDERGRVSGLVHVETADGLEHVAWTCASCHAEPDSDGDLVHGRASASLDRGALDPPLPDGTAPDSWSWGPGLLDVTADGQSNPTAIPDLRATSRQSHLHWAATLKNSLPALMVRTETLLITQTGRLRPPREIAVALALYVSSLGDAGAPGDAVANPDGALIFERECSRCHHADGSSGAPVPIALVGTDPRVGQSPARTTGNYRVPSLWAVADRSQLLHDGSVERVEEMFDVSRLAETPGHPFGLDLQDEQKQALVEFVRSIGGGD